MMEKKSITFEEWEKEGARLFGDDKKLWKFTCPACGHIISIQDYIDAKAQDSIAFSCIGRFIESKGTLENKEKPCNYTGGGLFRLNPLTIIDKGAFFNFATVKENILLTTA